MSRTPVTAGERGIVELFGLNRPVSLAVAAAIMVALASLGLAADGVDHPAGYLAAFVIAAIGGVAVLRGPGDPLAGWASAVTAATSVAATVLAALVCDPDARQPNLMINGLVSLIWLPLCFRGRSPVAWLSFAACLAALGIATALTGPMPGALFGQTGSAGILAIATVFARIVRPRAQQLALLFRRSRREEAVLDTELALQVMRDEQLSRLDQGARPLLELIASGAALTPQQVEDCRLVEAQLRDRIRAPGLDTPEIATAAWQARTRGAAVLLLDDRTGGDDDPSLLEPVRRRATRVLAGARRGEDITVRLLPRGRDLIATIAVVDDTGVDRTEFDLTGLPVAR